MLLASMAILGPAVARIVTLLAAVPPVGTAIAVLASIGLPLTLGAYDLLATRRVHRATIVGVTANFVAIFGALAVSGTGLGAALVTALE